MRILIADDDVDLTEVMSFALTREGHAVLVAHQSDEVVATFESEQPDLVLLDIGFGAVDGFEICQRMRESSNVPVIMVTARESEDDMARAFSLGADDYMTKPFSFRQLNMRVAAVARRSMVPLDTTLAAAGLRLDPANGEVTADGRVIQLTRIEFRLLHCLLAHQERVAPLERLLRFAWASDKGDLNVLKTHISHLRAKLGLNAPDARLNIRNVRGLGYRLEETSIEAGNKTRIK
jgi:DNA-binding response OmpR family regulator